MKLNVTEESSWTFKIILNFTFKSFCDRFYASIRPALRSDFLSLKEPHIDMDLSYYQLTALKHSVIISY